MLNLYATELYRVIITMRKKRITLELNIKLLRFHTFKKSTSC